MPWVRLLHQSPEDAISGNSDDVTCILGRRNPIVKASPNVPLVGPGQFPAASEVTSGSSRFGILQTIVYAGLKTLPTS
jgi:hypothetical protein